MDQSVVNPPSADAGFTPKTGFDYEIGRRRIKYEAELDPSFCEEMMRKVGNDSLRHCIQCGTCSATCPVAPYMDYTPRRIVAMTREGFRREVLTSFTPWLCASCYSCTVQCPKEVKITELMYTIKRKAIESHIHPKRFPVPALAKEFSNQVIKNGRTNEGRLITKVFLKTHPMRLLGNAVLGLKLFFKGRMEIFSHSIKNKKQLNKLLALMETNGTTKSDSN